MKMNMKNFSKISFALALAASSMLFSCEKRERIYYNWVYNGGNADVPVGQTALIDQDITGTVNADGTVIFIDGGVVNGDINVKNNGKAVIQNDQNKDPFFITSNVNLDDSLIINNHGLVLIEGNINSHANGDILIDGVSNSDTTIIKGNLNLDGNIYVKKGVLIVEGDFNLHGGGKINITNNANFVVKGTTHQDGYLYGSDNAILKSQDLHNPSNVFPKPLSEDKWLLQ